MLNIIQKKSPNFSTRSLSPQIVVLHIMSGTLIGTDDWFTRSSQLAGKPTSSHYGVGFKGEIHQYVDEKNSAWHAGVVDKPSFNLYKPGTNVNNYSIGIECEGYDLSKAPESQIMAIAELLHDICTRNNIPMDRDHIIGHYQINLKNRANCPATDKSIIDKIIARISEPMINIQVKKSQVDRVLQYIKTLV